MSAAPAARDEARSGGREYSLSHADFNRIARLVREESGIYLPENKTAFVYSRLVRRLRALQLESFSAYCALVDSVEGRPERAQMLEALTTNVTRFFREPHHFEHLRAQVLQPAADAARDGARLRLWSSGCSTGQEAYSIALTILAVLPEAAELDVRVLATDIDTRVLETARAGRYSDACISPVPRPLRDRWMVRHGATEWRLRDEVQSLIVFKPLNLMNSWPMRGRFDAIFCRNVVIYFDDETQRDVWRRFKDCLASNGRLYVGHSERVDVPGYASDGVTAYRLTGSQ